MRRAIVVSFLCGTLAACSSGQPEVAQFAAPQRIESHATDDAPPNAAPGTCWARERTPDRIETRAERVLVTPGDFTHDGSTLREAVWHTDITARIVEEGETLWFQTPCAADLIPDSTASLQRALSTRGLYAGTVDGQMQAETRAALRRFQEPLGLNSDVLSLDAAEKLGLVAVEAARARQTRPISTEPLGAAPGLDQRVY